ncbi:hypothetical protein ACH4SP_28335 [Streptomyces sp. NPDC021093]|uniref:hypothetical protein n=1 Tax=Streptomyces sp. NPDC021093 TaxID=3365112 RepID=UPI0037BC5DD8
MRVLRRDGETERESIRESTLEGLDAAARKGEHGGRPPVNADDRLDTALRRRAAEGAQADFAALRQRSATELASSWRSRCRPFRSSPGAAFDLRPVVERPALRPSA